MHRVRVINHVDSIQSVRSFTSVSACLDGKSNIRLPCRHVRSSLQFEDCIHPLVNIAQFGSKLYEIGRRDRRIECSVRGHTVIH